METEKTQVKEAVNFELFYKKMEDDPHKLEEAFVILLEMVISDPESTKNVALLIKEDYPALYKAIIALQETQKNGGDLPSCCGGH